MVLSGNEINTAIRKLYKLIAVVDEKTRECQLLDFDKEMINLPYEPKDFDEFCEELRKNIHPEEREDFCQFSDATYVKNVLDEKPFITIECRVRLADSRYYWNQITFCAVTCDKEDGGLFMLLIRDVNDKKERELAEIKDIMDIYSSIKDDYDELFEENMRDQQTGCYNRKGLKFYMDLALKKAAEKNSCLFVCVADMTGLKHINDTYGHQSGDLSLEVISKELKEHAPTDTVVVRTGGDEFLIFGPIDKDSTAPDEMGRMIDEDLEIYNKEHDHPFEVGVSYGWVIEPYKDGMTNLDEYIETADSKMYEMKKQRDAYRRD